MNSFFRILFIIQVIFLAGIRSSAQNELDVIRNNWLEYSDAANSLYHHLTSQAYDLLAKRKDETARLKSLADWQKRQELIRKTLHDIVGSYSVKTPLNAKIVRVLDKEGYKVEHIIYESLPRFYVTSSLFIPGGMKKNQKAPAIIYCSGHSAEGYRSSVYQHVILNLVKKGFIVFAFDPVGQGERLEYLEPEKGKSIVGEPTSEHSYPGAQAFIAGSSQAYYMILDGIRAVDYLITRKEVDPGRIGITGRSGGGTQSAFIAAMDDRIYAAAPENYITNYTRLLQSIGPQDAEQNLFNLISRGLDHPDFLIVRAPKPALLITTTNDMFNIQGAMETEKEVTGIYKAYGKEDNFRRIEDNAGHASTLKNREAMYAFFRKHLNNPGNNLDEEAQPLTAEELRVTSTGQVSTSLGGETVFSLNRKLAEENIIRLTTSRNNPEVFLPEAVHSAQRLSGYREPEEVGEPVFTGRIQRGKYSIEKYFINGEGEYVIPYLLFRPGKPGNRVMIYLHPSGKAAEAGNGGEIERYVNQGITVLAPDLPGTGELGQGALKGDAYFKGASHNLWYASMVIGRSITGIQAGDVVRLVRILKNNNASAEITGFARKEMAPVLLHAAAFEPAINEIILVEPFSSYRSIVMNRFYNPFFILSAVPGALRKYDLPDLAGSLAPRKLVISGVTDGNGGVTDSSGIDKDLEIIRSVYHYRKADSNLLILAGNSDKERNEQLLEWINR
ncbi:MAG: acetylxylan esterase [Bacteroidales bacterium]|nr:acetylxylan esterase [Bacteroidales bacterium]